MTTSRSTASGRSSAAPSTSASPTSTWPTTTARRTARPRPTSAGTSPRTSRRYRDELVLSTKAGYDMWPGPYGEWGVAASTCSPRLDQSLRGWASTTSTSSTATGSTRDAARGDDGRAATPPSSRARRSTSASRRYSPERTREAAGILRDLGTPLLIHQPSYSMLNRWVEGGPPRRPGGRRRGLHHVLPAGAGDAHRPLPRRRPGGLPRRAGQVAVARPADRAEPHPHPRARRAGAPTAARRSRRWRSRGPCATSG